MASGSSGSTQPHAAATQSTKWQEALIAACQDRKMSPPQWQMFSDRRGGRTAWTCTVAVGGESVQARNWYDGSYVNNAKEDAAELALRRLGFAPTLAQSQQPQAVAGASPPSSQGQGGGGWYS